MKFKISIRSVYQNSLNEFGIECVYHNEGKYLNKITLNEIEKEEDTKNKR